MILPNEITLKFSIAYSKINSDFADTEVEIYAAQFSYRLDDYLDSYVYHLTSTVSIVINDNYTAIVYEDTKKLEDGFRDTIDIINKISKWDGKTQLIFFFN